jgi:hypothetical protein
MELLNQFFYFWNQREMKVTSDKKTLTAQLFSEDPFLRLASTLKVGQFLEGYRFWICDCASLISTFLRFRRPRASLHML